MKFFSDLGSCYRPTTTTAAAEADEVVWVPSPVTGPRVGGDSSSRRKSLKSKPGSGLHWQPTLSAISEDHAAAAAEKVDGRRSGHQVLKKSPVKGRDMVKSRSSFSTGDGDYYRESSMVMAMPAFSPTPFMF